MRWLGSYESPRFDTPTGELGFDEYAVIGQGRGGRTLYRIRIPDEAKRGPRQVVGDMLTTSNPEHIAGKRLVEQADGSLYFHEFLNEETGEVQRIPTTKQAHDRLRTTPGEAKPKHPSDEDIRGR